MTSQKLSPDELNKLEDEQLLSLFNKVILDSVYAESVALTYLNRGKFSKDSIKMARGYDRLARIYNPAKNLVYADSVIFISEEMKNKTYPAQGYILKAYNYKLLANIDSSVDNYIRGNELAYMNENLIHKLHTNEMLIFFKTYWGDPQDAMLILNKHISLIESVHFIDDLKKNSRTNIDLDFEKFSRKYKLGSYISLASIYLESNDINEAKKAIRLAKAVREKDHDSVYSDIFLEIEMEIAYFQKDYNNVHSIIEEILKVNRSIYGENAVTKNSNMGYFEGMSFLGEGNISRAVKSFVFADSLYQSQKILIFPRHRQLYLELIKHYDSIGNKKAQMEYLNKLIKWDSIFNANYRHIDSKIIKEFETPRLLAQKEALIAQLEEENSLISKKSTWIFVLLLMSLGLIPYFVVRQRKLKKRFDALIKTTDSEVKKIPKSPSKSTLSSEIIDEIMNKLERFEEQQKYLSGSVSLQSVAKSFNTNSSYLSKVVNLYKDKNFSQYLNDLRVDYAIKELTNNARFRRYTIKAIAQDVGFGNSQSFSKAFHLKTGLQPSYFVRKLNKQAS